MTAADLHYETDVEIRYSDLDTFAHVNNAVYVTYCEQARVRYFEDVLGLTLPEISFVVAHMEVDYQQPITGVGDLTVAMGITDFGRTSFTMTYELRFEGEVVATAETVQVVVDDSRSPAPVPEAWRERVAAARESGTTDRQG